VLSIKTYVSRSIAGKFSGKVNGKNFPVGLQNGKQLPLLILSSFFLLKIKACETNTDSLLVGRLNLQLFNSSKELP
jgi:hypothetical protein